MDAKKGIELKVNESPFIFNLNKTTMKLFQEEICTAETDSTSEQIFFIHLTSKSTRLSGEIFIAPKNCINLYISFLFWII